MSNYPVNKTDPGSNERPQTLVQNAMHAIIEHIRQNKLVVGDKLPSEAIFVEKLAVSRTVVREAFKSLAAIRIIEMSSGRRAQVAAFDDNVFALTLAHALRTDQINVQQIWDARHTIEIRTVALAALHRSVDEAESIRELSRKMREHYNDVALMTEYDIAFHIAIARATRNPLFPVLIASLTAAMRETNPIVWAYRKTQQERLEVVLLHEKIAETIGKGDPEAAIDALEQHFGVASSGLLKAGVC